MLIQHMEDETKGAFYIEENDNVLAELVYTKEPGRIIIQHTEVDETLRGQNIGFQLVDHAVELAREQHVKIVPLCHFAKKVIEDRKEFQDVL